MADGETALKFQMIVQNEAGQMQALGWSLRCTAFAAFSEHPDFRP